MIVQISFLPSLCPKCFWVCSFLTTNLLNKRLELKDSQIKTFIGQFFYVMVKSHSPPFIPPFLILKKVFIIDKKVFSLGLIVWTVFFLRFHH